MYRQRNIFIIVGMYVDNLALVLQGQDGLDWLKGKIAQEFDMKDLGEVKTIIGWEIIRDF